MDRRTGSLHRRHAGTIYATAALPAYRRWYPALRAKHAQLYTRAARRRLAAESDLGPLGRGPYRWYWGPRPVPARVELALYRWLWEGADR